MATPAVEAAPVVPPRPSRSSDKETSNQSPPVIPPRPSNRRIERSKSPNADRFAQSPLNGGIGVKSSGGARLSPGGAHGEQYDDPVDRSGSVGMPSLGEEGMEYGAIAQELQHDKKPSSRPVSPEQTRTVAEDLKLHAPKPSLPAQSAKQRVMTVTRTDSNKAASFGIGKPGNSDDQAPSREGLKKKPSTTFSTASDIGNHTDDEHGIPEIGRRVPMNPYLGDVQAPSPGPNAEEGKRHHTRKLSARSLPPGSYGLHGHGVGPQDKLDKVYYQKNPSVLEREQQHTPLHDRQNDYAMSSSDLNKLVRDTASRGAAIGTTEHRSTPNDEVAFQASEEYATRIMSPRPASSASKAGASSPTKEASTADDDMPIHVDDSRHPEHYNYGDESHAGDDGAEYTAPILASDEVKKDDGRHLKQPAIRPHLERHGSSYGEDSTSRPVSRPASRPTSIYNSLSQSEFGHTPLEDVREYEPLFPEEAARKEQEKRAAQEAKARHHFPSKDIWEDAPNSVHETAEVSTPDTTEDHRRKSSTHHDTRPITPAHAFALYQEELAEKEASGRKNNFLPLSEEKKPTWVDHQPHLKSGRPGVHRFPSRDVWEESPESLMHETELSESPNEEVKEDIPEVAKEDVMENVKEDVKEIVDEGVKEDVREDTRGDTQPSIPARPAKKPEIPPRPAVPERPKSRQNSGDDASKSRPPVLDKPKPQVPARPVKKLSGDSGDGEFSKPKPPVPSRPAGSKIAALQAGFMSDLNKRLQLGPQAPKKEEEQQEVMEEKEKVPLTDARKGRARGPQRRAPAKSPVPAAAATASAEASKAPALTLSFSLPQTLWSIDPEAGDCVVGLEEEEVLKRESIEEANSEPPKPSDSEQTETERIPVIQEPQESQVPEKVEAPVKIEQPEEPLETIVPSEVSEKLVEAQKPEEPQKHEESETLEEPDKPAESAPPVEAVKEVETLATNTAGESILEAMVEKKDGGNEVEPVEVKEDVKA